MRLAVDQELCCGAGTCVMLAPEVFDQRDEDGVVVLLDERPPEELFPMVREAASTCPALAILISEQA